VLPPERGSHDETLWDIASLVLDDTIIGLCSCKTIPMIAPHTSWTLSGGELDDDTAVRFNIGYVLETALRRRGDADFLVVKLFDTRTRVIIWADTYPLSADSLAASHRGLSAAITMSLADAVESSEIARFRRDENPQAYYWHLMGQKYLRFMDLPNIRRALKAFRKAVAADPAFAPAFSGSARATQRQWLVLGRGDPALLAEAEQIGARAISLDHRDARGYREVALCSLYRRRWDDAVANFTEAERLGPQYADLFCDFGDALGHAGEPEKGLAKVERAIELNPIPPDQYWWNAAGLHFQLHDYALAIDAIDRMGDPLPALRVAAAAWAYLGKKTEARKCAAKFLRSYPDFRIAHWLSIVPDKNPDDQRHYELGLQLAGFK
jgi:tetratricopeptide (TPR) repeat protein